MTALSRQLQTGGAALTVAALVAVAMPLYASAQTARPQFDVASIKPNRGEQGPQGINFSPSGRFAWTRVTLAQLMQFAYADQNVVEFAGGPSWTRTDRFDIAAISANALQDLAPDGAPRGVFARLRTLLEERFQLKAHVEMRPMPVFLLRPATTPMKPGPNLTLTTIDCAAVNRDIAAGRRPEVPEGQMPPCGMRLSLGQVNGHAISMERLASVLSNPASRPVIDRTDLQGAYDISLKWAPELPPGALLNGAPPPPNEGPSIFTAVREQLGLSLDAARADVRVLVIDSVQPPTPD